MHLEPSNLELVFGSRGSEFLAIRPLRRSASGQNKACYWDGNWIAYHVEAAVHGFRASYDAFVRTGEVVALRAGLERLKNDLGSELEFATMEEQVAFRIRGDRLGRLDLRGEPVHPAGLGSRLSFSLELDQTFLPGLLSSVDALVQAYPVLGRP